MTSSLSPLDPLLPTDLPSAHAEITSLRGQVAEMEVLRIQLLGRERQIRTLQAKLDELTRRVFGKKSEKLDPRQLRLALDLLAIAVELSPDGEPIESDSGETYRRARVRNRSREGGGRYPSTYHAGRRWWTCPRARSAAPVDTTCSASVSR